MSNSLKAIILSAIAVVTCAILSIAFFVTGSGKNELNENLDQINKVAKQYANGELLIYNDKVVTGEEVIFAVKKYSIRTADSKISENPLRVKVDIVSKAKTLEVNYTSLSDLQDVNSQNYVNPNSQYNATLVTKDNVVTKIVFSLLENYVSNANELDGYDHDMASTSTTQRNTSSPAAVDTSVVDWEDSSERQDDIDKIDEDSGLSDKEWEYYVDNGEIVITKYNGRKVTVSVPTSLEDKPVKALANEVFKGNTKIQKVTIPDCISSIGSGVFSGCTKLQSAILPKNLKVLSANTFYNCNQLSSLDIPSTVTTIDDGCFHSCTLLDGITIPTGLKNLGKGSFYACANLSSVSLPPAITAIEDSTFFGCTSLKSISVDNGSAITKIGNAAFVNCKSMNKFNFTNTVSIGNNAFKGCTSLESVSAPKIKTLGENAFFDCSSITQVDLLNATELTTIENATFSGCTSLNRVKLPNSVSSFKLEAFRNCSSLEYINMTDNLKSIGSYAFYGCSSLSDLSFTSSLKSVGTGTFSNCSGLNKVYFYATADSKVPSFGRTPFANHNDDLTLYVYYNSTAHKLALKDNIKYVLLDASDWLYEETSAGIVLLKYLGNDTSVTVPGMILSKKVIGFGKKDVSADTESIFGDKYVETVFFEGNVQWIGTNAFKGCSNIVRIDLPNSVTSIGVNSFNGCSSLASISGLDSVKSVGDYAFKNCSSLESLELPNSVSSLGKGAFSNCEQLTDFTLPVKISSIPDELFSGCSKLSNLEHSGYKKIGASAFEGTAFVNFIMPNGVTEIGNNAFKDTTKLTNIVVSNALTKIGVSSFENSAINEFIMPVSVTEIPNAAFKNCKDLSKLSLHNDIATVGTGAFIGCVKLGDVTWNKKDKPLFEADSFVRSDDLVFYVYRNSTAHKFAVDNNIKYVLMNKISDDWEFTINDNDTITLDRYIGTDIDNIIVPDSIDDMPTVCFGSGKPVFEGKIVKNVSIPDSITSIDSYAFKDCTSLNSVVINSGSCSFGEYAFENCSNLTNFSISDPINKLSIGLFKGCSSLEWVPITNNPINIPDEAFSGCTNLSDNTVELDFVTIGDNAFYNCSSIRNLCLTDSLTTVGANALANTKLNIAYASLSKNVVWNPTALTGADINVGVYPYSYADFIFYEQSSSFKFSGITHLEEYFFSVSEFKITSQPYIVSYDVGSKFIPDGIEVKGVINDSSTGVSGEVTVWDYESSGGWSYEDPGTEIGTRKVTVNVSRGSNEASLQTCDCTWSNSDIVITKQPTNWEGYLGEKPTFSCEASAGPNTVSYQWEYYSTDESIWKNVDGGNTNTLTSLSTTTKYEPNLQFRCKLTAASNTKYTNVVTLNVWYTMSITTQPSNVTVKDGSTATFSCIVSAGNPTTLNYQWQYSTDGTNWSDCGESAAKTASFSFTAGKSINGRQYRCKVYNDKFTVYTDAATLTVQYSFTLNNPSSVSIYAGQSADFTCTVATSGNPNSYTYQWQYSSDGGSNWNNYTDTDTVCNVYGYKSRNGYKFRCSVSNGVYTFTSSAATLTVNDDFSIYPDGKGTYSSNKNDSYHNICYSPVTGRISSKGYSPNSWTWSISGNTSVTSGSGTSISFTSGNSNTGDATVTCQNNGTGEKHSITVHFHRFEATYSQPYTGYVSHLDTVTYTSNCTAGIIKFQQWASDAEINAMVNGVVSAIPPSTNTVSTSGSASVALSQMPDRTTVTTDDLSTGGNATFTAVNPYNSSDVRTYTFKVHFPQFRTVHNPVKVAEWDAGDTFYRNLSHNASNFSQKKNTYWFRYMSSALYYYTYTPHANVSATGGGVFSHYKTESSGKTGYSGYMSAYKVSGTGAGTATYTYTNYGSRKIVITVTVNN